MRLERSVLFAGAVACAACSTPAPPAGDAGTPIDAGALDVAVTDAHVYVRPDGGPTGAAIMPSIACDAIAASLYDTPAGLSPFTVDVRGALLGCAQLETVSAAELTTRLAGVPDLGPIPGGVRVYLVAYRTEREPRGVGGISTALVVLPDVALSDHVPMVLAAHGSIGLDDHCAPSRYRSDPASTFPPDYGDAMLFAWAARGLPVVMPDYAGLGTEGVHGYGNWADPARSAIDGLRALRAMLPVDRLTGSSLVYGHSQGGGIALSVAAYASEAPDVTIGAVVAMAPGYKVASLVDAFDLTTVALTPVLTLVASYTLYADLANVGADATHVGDAFAPAVRDRLVEIAGTQCFDAALTAVATPTSTYTPPATVGDLADPAFRDGVHACAAGTCTGLPGAVVMREDANDPHLPGAASPPVLVVASSTDDQATIGAVGCVMQALRADHAPADYCETTAIDHLGVVSHFDAYGLAWALAAVSGTERPPCPEATTIPRCSLF